jgi:hypothetical protein
MTTARFASLVETFDAGPRNKVFRFSYGKDVFGLLEQSLLMREPRAACTAG